jgi:HTH-type transcriptional regulator/antitoxin HigA
MNVKLIKTKKDYDEALSKIENMLAKGLKKGSKEGDELEILLLLVEKYEDAHFPIDAPDPVEAIKFRMEQMDLKPKDLEAILGNKSLVSKILNRKRSLSLAMIRSLNKALHIPTEILIREYSPKVKFKSKKAKFNRI